MTPTFLGMRLPIEGLTVIGEAVHDVSPEVIELSFDIHSVGLSAAIALQDNAAKVTHIGQALAAIGKTETDITTGGVEVVPILQLPNPSLTMPNPFLLQSAFATSGASVPMSVAPAASENPSLVGYRAVNSIKVVVRNVSRAGEVVDIVTRAGATPNGSIRYLLQDEETLERTLLEKAVRRAREKATVLAAAVGRTTGAPISISEEITAHQPHLVYANGRQNPFSMPIAAAARPPFINGQLTFSAKVSVVYPLQ